MKCEEVLEKIDKITDSWPEVEFKKQAEKAAEIIEHLKVCAACKNYFLFLNRISNLKIVEEEPSGEFTERVMEKILLRKRTGLFPKVGLKIALATAGLALFALFYGPKIALIKNGNMKTVNFSIYYPEAKKISIAGSFNDWEKDTLFLKNKKGDWHLKIKLPKGKYEYVYIIDGKKLLPDPKRVNISDGFGSFNSLLEI